VLSQHPYIRYSLARALIEYRNQHGPFANPEDLEKLHLITRDILNKILPYLKIG
jgi:DNA uptake protein ComE-like DNA-binding protein